MNKKLKAFSLLAAGLALGMSQAVHAGFASSYILGVPTSASGGAIVGFLMSPDEKGAGREAAGPADKKAVVRGVDFSKAKIIGSDGLPVLSETMALNMGQELLIPWRWSEGAVSPEAARAARIKRTALDFLSTRSTTEGVVVRNDGYGKQEILVEERDGGSDLLIQTKEGALGRASKRKNAAEEAEALIGGVLATGACLAVGGMLLGGRKEEDAQISNKKNTPKNKGGR